MNNTTIKKIGGIIALLLLVTSFSFAQNEASIQLLNYKNQSPIIGAAFTYGQQNGSSDQEGYIYFQWQEMSSLQLSHLNYGNWELSAQEVEQAIREGSYLRRQIDIEIQPMTIIALRTPVRADKLRELDFMDQVAHDATQILRQSPAFSAIQKGGNYGFDPVFRGFKYEQLNVVLDGAQSAIAACPNRMDPPGSQMAPNMMDRIEVLKGPHALRYGTGVGATLNFVPAALQFSPQSAIYGRISSAWESNGQVSRSEGKIGWSGQNYDWSLFSAWAQGNDYQTGAGTTVAADFQRASFGSQLGLRLNEQQQIRLSALYNRARDADFPAQAMDLREDDTWLFSLQHEANIQQGQLSRWQTTLFGSWVDHKMDNLLKEITPRMLDATTNAQTYNYGGRTEGTWQFYSGKLYLGADLRIEGAQGIRERSFLMGPNAGRTVYDNAWQNSRIQKSGLFTEYHQALQNYQLVISARLEYNQGTLHDPADAFTLANPVQSVNQINPNLSIGLSRRLGNNLKMGLWLGRAQRSGSLTERYINYFPIGLDPYELVGNPALAPEKNNQIDLSIDWKQNTTSIKVDLFAAYLQDYISSFIDSDLSPRLPTSPGVRRYTNIENALMTGVELSYRQKLGQGLQQQVSLAYTCAQDLERTQPLPEIAPLDIRYVLRGQYWNNRLQPQVSVRYVSAQKRISPEFGETATPDFLLLDLSMRYQAGKDLQFRFGAYNLLDEAYYEHLSRSVRGTSQPILAPGRNISLGINFQF